MVYLDTRQNIIVKQIWNKDTGQNITVRKYMEYRH